MCWFIDRCLLRDHFNQNRWYKEHKFRYGEHIGNHCVTSRERHEQASVVLKQTKKQFHSTLTWVYSGGGCPMGVWKNLYSHCLCTSEAISQNCPTLVLETTQGNCDIGVPCTVCRQLFHGKGSFSTHHFCFYY